MGFCPPRKSRQKSILVLVSVHTAPRAHRLSMARKTAHARGQGDEAKDEREAFSPQSFPALCQCSHRSFRCHSRSAIPPSKYLADLFFPLPPLSLFIGFCVSSRCTTCKVGWSRQHLGFRWLFFFFFFLFSFFLFFLPSFLLRVPGTPCIRTTGCTCRRMQTRPYVYL